MLFNLKHFRRTHEDNKDSLNILPTDVDKILLEFLIPSDDTMIINSITLFHFLKLTYRSSKIINYLLEKIDHKIFRCVYVLKRDDEILIRYSASQQTIEWILESNSFKDIINYDELKQIYELSRYQSQFVSLERRLY